MRTVRLLGVGLVASASLFIGLTQPTQWARNTASRLPRMTNATTSIKTILKLPNHAQLSQALAGSTRTGW